jgi:formylmethanofuran dehydrogenase subunit C
MRGGTILALGPLGPHAGAGMHRGSIVAFGAVPLWPAFVFDCVYDPAFARLYLRALNVVLPSGAGGAAEAGAIARYQFARYHGDVTALGKGEILLWQPTP